ncbi:MAG: GTPase HflX [Candidatus Cloacimonadaceae bacterium]|nr:GTPase HflX [Candidatus Cloacimonadaceae bacterium]
MSKEEFDILDEFESELEDWEVLQKPQNTAFIATIVKQGDKAADIDASLDEMERLADTAGIDILGRYFQRRNMPERSTYFGKGFLEDLQQKMLQAQAELLIINEELSPMQVRNIEKKYEITVIDRTEVILSIFHDHAKTKEAKLQVRLAELQYQLPRLRRLWGHFDKERGSVRSTGGSAARGMGEKQIEIDKRLIRTQISRIRKAIGMIVHQKETQRKQRTKAKKICLVGYTNAGKSTLFNALTDAGVLVEDKLFATLDSTTRQLKMTSGSPLVISDTVGFISNLPHHLVASFQATLMEVEDADLLLHIVDASDERFQYYIEQVNVVLTKIGADQIRQILVFNKTDRLENNFLPFLEKGYPGAVCISAAQQTNLESLRTKIEELLFQTIGVKLLLPYEMTSLVSRLHEISEITSEDYREDGIHLNLNIEEQNMYLVKEYIVKE